MSNKSSQTLYDEITEISDEICSAWEIDFLESIGQRLGQGCELSPAQRAVLERIYAKACASAY